MLRKVFPAIVVCFAAGCAQAVGTAVREQPIQLLLVSDVYIGEPMTNGLGGVARLTTLRNQLAAEGPVKMFLAGDFIFPSLLSKWYKGAQIVEYFNAAGLDYATYGNHEFDDSRASLVNRVSESRFKWTSANCMSADGTPIPGVSAWDTVTISGVKFGILGLTLAEGYPRWINCRDPDSVAHMAIPKLRNAGAQIIVGFTHQLRAADSSLLANEPEIDFILGGHEHTAQAVEIGNRFVLKADQNAQSAQLVTLIRKGKTWSRAHRLIQIDATIPQDPATQALVERWQDSLRKRLGPEQTIATAPQRLLEAGDFELRRSETPFGNLVADAIRIGSSADVAVTISGSIRFNDDIPAGQITDRQIESIYLFSDETRIVTFNTTGDRLRAILEHSISRGGVRWAGYSQVSGVRFSWDSTRPVGSRIVADVFRTDGSVIKATDSLRLSVNAYTACESGDGYSIPESSEACKSRDAGPRAAQLLIDYLRAQGTVVLPPIGRVTRIK